MVGTWVPAGPNEVDAERAHLLHTNLCKAIGAGRQIAYVIAEILWEIKNCEYYVTLGYNSFHEYTMSPEIGLGKSQAYKLADIYELFVKELGWKPENFDEIPDIDRLAIVAPLIRQLRASNAVDAQNQIEELIEDAKVLSRDDLKRKKREWLGGSGDGPLGQAKQDDALQEFVGQVLIAAESRIEPNGSRKIVFVFENDEGQRRKIVFFASGPDVDYNTGKLLDATTAEKTTVDSPNSGW